MSKGDTSPFEHSRYVPDSISYSYVISLKIQETQKNILYVIACDDIYSYLKFLEVRIYKKNIFISSENIAETQEN